MDKKVAIICEAGFDGGGTTKLGIEYSKLGLNVFMRNFVQPLQSRPDANTLQNIVLYDDLNDLRNTLSEYDRLIFLPFIFSAKDLESKFVVIANFVQSIHCDDACYLFCSRKPDFIVNLLNLQKKYNFWFNHYFSITPTLKNFVDNVTVMDVNAYSFSEDRYIIPEIDRNRIVFTAGRVEAVKGITSYFKCIDDEFLRNGDFTYIHEGAKFSFSKNGTVHVSPQLLPLFNLDSHPKVLKHQFELVDWNTKAVPNKLTIYPSYKVDSTSSRWSTYYAGICCILGTKSKIKYLPHLFGAQWVIDDASESNRIAKNKNYWINGLEYATLEMIDFGIPVLLSRTYASILDYSDNRLIYDSFYEIPFVLNNLHQYYDDTTLKQRETFKLRQHDINATIVKNFMQSCLGG